MSLSTTAANVPADSRAIIDEQRALSREQLATHSLMQRVMKESEIESQIIARGSQSQQTIIGNLKSA